MDELDVDLVVSVFERLEEKYKVFENLAELSRICQAVNGRPALPGRDESGGYVSCLTEATMGITAGLFKVAEAVRELAHAVSDLETK
jgi:hypothetical protein